MSRLTLMAVVTCLLSGCSLTYLDNEGVEHSFGLVQQKLKTTDEMVYVEKDYYGASLNLTAEDGGATLGYKKSIRVFVPEDAILTIDNHRDEINTKLQRPH